MGYRHGDTDVSTTPGEGAEGKAKPEAIATARRVREVPLLNSSSFYKFCITSGALCRLGFSTS